MRDGEEKDHDDSSLLQTVLEEPRRLFSRIQTKQKEADEHRGNCDLCLLSRGGADSAGRCTIGARMFEEIDALLNTVERVRPR